MKLLILSNCKYPDPTTLEECTTRTELFILLFKLNLNNFDGIELLVENCNPYLNPKPSFTNLTPNYFSISDHTLFIDDYGFYKKNESFINQIKKTTKYSISTLLNNIKFSRAEDITFTFANSLHNKKSIFIKPPLDEHIYAPRKEKNIIYILLDKPSPLIKSFNIDMQVILQKINKLILKNINNGLVFKIGIIDHNSVDFVNIDGNTIEQKKFKMFIDFVYEISKANIFILTHKCIDTYFLYELAMCNTLIISKINIIDKRIIDELKIYTYNDKLKWDDVFNMLLTYNSRQSLLENSYTWNNMIENMIGKFKEFEKSTNITKPISDNTEQNNKLNNKTYVLNIQHKNKPHIYEKINKPKIISDNNPVKPKKNVLLQSRLLK
jgi:hypothetical protein